MADGPMINISLADFDKLRNENKDTQAKCYELEKQLAAAQLGDDTAAKLLHAAFHDAIKVVQFAVGNLDPSTVSGWPHEALRKIADAIEKIPGVDPHVAELPPELRAFADVARGLEAYRRERDKNKVVTAATAADFGPKTPEAAAVHAAYDAKRNAAPDEQPPTDATSTDTVQVP
jgi:hypothetical protein